MNCIFSTFNTADDDSRRASRQSPDKQTHFYKGVSGGVRMHEFKTVVKRWTLKDRYSWRPKSVLNYRARSAPRGSPGKIYKSRQV